MNPGKFFIFLSTLLVLAGCQGLGQASYLPAVVVEPDQSSRDALEFTLSEIFGGQQVTLADDALTQTSILTLEHSPGKQLDSQPALGRVVTKPLQFQLVKSGDECFLVDLRDARRYMLADTSCAPE
jgi:hypothetical protein